MAPGAPKDDVEREADTLAADTLISLDAGRGTVRHHFPGALPEEASLDPNAERQVKPYAGCRYGLQPDTSASRPTHNVQEVPRRRGAPVRIEDVTPRSSRCRESSCHLPIDR